MAGGLEEPIVPKPENIALPALSAFIATSNINTQRQKIEAQLQRMEFENREKDQMLAMRQSNYESLDALRKIEGTAALARSERLANKADKAEQLSLDGSNAVNALNNIPFEVGTAPWRKSANLIHYQYNNYFQSPEGQRTWGDYWDEHKFASAETQRNQKAVLLDSDKLMHQLDAEGISPYSFENEKQWAYIDKNGMETDDPKEAVSRALKRDSTGKILPPDTPWKDVDSTMTRTVPVQNFNLYRDQIKAGRQILKDYATGQQPDPVGGAGYKSDQAAIPFPADKTKAVAGQLYQTPKGNLTWTGSGFLPPQ